MLRFRINGIPIGVQPVFWLLALLLGLGSFNGADLALWVAIVFVSVLIHELGHAFTAQIFGRSPSVVLHGFGGVTSWAAVPELSPVKRIATTLAGPLSGFALAGIAWMAMEYGGLDDESSTAWLAAIVLMRVNLLWGAFNLIPIRGLDGGQTVAGLLALVWPKRAEAAAEVVYIVAGVGAAIFGFARGFPLLGVFALILTFGGMRWRGARNAEPGEGEEPADGAAPPLTPERSAEPGPRAALEAREAEPRRVSEPTGDGEPPLLGI